MCCLDTVAMLEKSVCDVLNVSESLTETPASVGVKAPRPG